MDMKTRAKIAAVLAAKPDAKKTSDDKLDEIRKILDEEEDPAAEGEEEDPPAAEGEEEDPPAAEGEEEEETEARKRGANPSATANGKGRIKAILSLPEAKGREAQAQHIALETDLTVEQAKGMLAAAPKVSRLADKVTDPKLSAEGGKKPTEEQQLDDAAFALAGIRPKPAR
jgi:ATP-dependent Clp protease protease subunit